MLVRCWKSPWWVKASNTGLIQGSRTELNWLAEEFVSNSVVKWHILLMNIKKNLGVIKKSLVIPGRTNMEKTKKIKQTELLR